MAISARVVADLLSEPDFRRVWTIGWCSGVCRWLEMLVVAIYAFELTGSPFLVALAVVVRLAPMVLFGSLFGAAARTIAPRMLMLAGQLSGLAIALGVALAFALDADSYGLIIVASFAAGTVRTSEITLRRRMVADVAGRDRLVPAHSFDNATINLTRMLGPLIGGVTFQWLGPAGAFALSASLYLLAAVMVAGLGVGGRSGEAGAVRGGMWRDLSEGFAYVAGRPDIVRILSTTVVFNVFGVPVLSMIPVVGRSEFELSPALVGVLTSLEGAGAFLCAMALALTNPKWPYRRLFYSGALGYLFFALIAGSMSHAMAFAAAVFCIGLATSGYASMQATLIYTVAAPEMRDRVFGLAAICMGAGLVGVANVGLMGELYGASRAIQIIAPRALWRWHWSALAGAN